jgi:hypothetical protein
MLSAIKAFSHAAREGPDEHSFYAGSAERLRTLIDRGARRENIIDEQDRPPLQAVHLSCGKGSAHVLNSVCSM